MEAYRRVFRVGEEFQRLRFNKGAGKSAKGNPDHSALFEIGLDLGLDPLSPEELADCFDELCPCGKSHDADGLKKQRSRIKKALREAEAWLQAERAKLPTREWMFAFGMHGLWAKGVQAIGGAPRRVDVGKVGGRVLWCVAETGEVMIPGGREFSSVSAVQEMLYGLNVHSSKELFGMFFPPPEPRS